MKALRFSGASLQALAELPERARRRAAFELRQMQLGLPSSFAQTPVFMLVAGVQAYELHVRRCVVCLTEWADTVQVLHVFRKISRELHRREMALAIERYRQMTARTEAAAVATHASSGNVFLDLGYPGGQAATMALRADLMGRLRLLARSHGWKREQVQEHFGIAPTSANDLMHGRWDRFSLEKLVPLSCSYLALDPARSFHAPEVDQDIEVSIHSVYAKVPAPVPGIPETAP